MQNSADLPETSAEQFPDTVMETQTFWVQPQTFRGALHQVFQVFDRESNFILQLLVVFMCSVAVVPAIRQALQPGPMRVSQLPVLTQQVRLPEARPQIGLSAPAAMAEAPQQATRTAAAQKPVAPRVQLVPLPVVNLQPLPPRSPRLFSQQANRSAVRKNHTPARKSASQRPIKRITQDPIAPVRTILKQDYQISKANGSYESYMKWVRSTLKRYQSES